MFVITEKNINETARKFENIEAGGFLVFCGCIRSKNDGRDVVKLEYSCYKKMAEAVGGDILQKAMVDFSLLGVRAVHRVGVLSIGEVALYLELCSAHRKECLEACDFIIDEIKDKVPIWKKEFYKNDEYKWL